MKGSDIAIIGGVALLGMMMLNNKSEPDNQGGGDGTTIALDMGGDSGLGGILGGLLSIIPGVGSNGGAVSIPGLDSITGALSTIPEYFASMDDWRKNIEQYLLTIPETIKEGVQEGLESLDINIPEEPGEWLQDTFGGNPESWFRSMFENMAKGLPSEADFQGLLQKLADSINVTVENVVPDVNIPGMDTIQQVGDFITGARQGWERFSSGVEDTPFWARLIPPVGFPWMVYNWATYPNKQKETATPSNYTHIPTAAGIGMLPVQLQLPAAQPATTSIPGMIQSGNYAGLIAEGQKMELKKRVSVSNINPLDMLRITEALK